MKEKIITFPAIIDGVQSKKDRTINIKLGTPELKAEETAHIFSLAQNQVWCALKETPIKIEDLDFPEEIKEFKTDKSLSERLRNVLYVYWDTKTDKSNTFEEFRKIKMEQLINHFKEKLD